MFQGPNEVHKNAILIERYKHTLYHCMHGKDIELCPFINNESEKKVNVTIYLYMCIILYH